MSPSPSKHVEIKLKRCDTNEKLIKTGKKKLHSYERLRKTRRYTAFLAEAFSFKDSGLLTGCELPSSIEEGHKLDVPSVPISPSSCRVDWEKKDEQPLQVKPHYNNHWDVDTTTIKRKVCSVDTISVLGTYLKTNNRRNGILDSEGFSVSSKPSSKICLENPWQNISSTQETLEHSSCCLSSVSKQKRKWLLSKKLKENNNNYSNKFLNLESFQTRLQKLPAKWCASQNLPTGLRHSQDSIRKSLRSLLEKFGNSSYVLWQCKFCPYSGIPLRVKHHTALKHLAVLANENGLFGCPHCDGQFASYFTFKRHLRRVHAGRGMRPCCHCNLTVPYQKFGSHIYNEHVAAITHSTASTKKQLSIPTPSSATEQLAAIGQSDTPAQSVMPAFSATTRSESSLALKTTGSNCASTEIHRSVSSEAFVPHTDPKTQSTKQLKKMLTVTGKCVQQSAVISRSNALPPINPKTHATAPLRSLEKGLSNGLLENPYLSKVSLEALGIIYQSIENEGVNHCPICLFSSSKPDLLKHLFENHMMANINHNGEIICPHCDIVSLTGEKYSLHLRTMHTTLYPCPLCSKVLPQSESLLRHLNCHFRHKIASLNKEKIGRLPKKRVPNQMDAKSLHNAFISAVLQRHARGKFKCPLCYYCTKFYFDFKRHLRKVHLAFIRNKSNKIKCSHCSKVFLRDECYKSHLLIYHSMKFPCPHCSQQFSVKNHLEKHLGMHIQPFVQLEYLQDVPFEILASTSASTGYMEKKFEDSTCFDCSCLRPLITAKQTHTEDSGHCCSHGHSADMDANSFWKGPSKHDLYSCSSSLNEVAFKHEPCSPKTEIQHAEQLNNTEGHDGLLMPITSTSSEEGHVGLSSLVVNHFTEKDEVFLEHISCTTFAEEGLKVPLLHGSCPFPAEHEGLLRHIPCTSSNEGREAPLPHVNPFTDEHVRLLRHIPCSGTDDAQPVTTEHHFGLASNKICICPLCSQTSETLRHCPSHLRKAHQNTGSCYYFSLCHHTENVPSSFELHRFGCQNSNCETNSDGYDACTSSYCCNVDCKMELEEFESNLLHCSCP